MQMKSIVCVATIMMLVAAGDAASGACTVDIVFTSAAPTASPSSAAIGDTVTLSSFTFKNQGTTDAPQAFYLTYFFSTSPTATGTYLGQQAVDLILRAGQSVTWTSLSHPALKVPAGIRSGSYYIVVFADYANSICESNETNNSIASTPISVQGTCTTSDLVITSGTPTIPNSTTVAAGAKVLVPSFTVKNQGSASTGTLGISHTWYLSTDAVITPADRGLLDLTSGPLAAGATWTSTYVEVTIPASTASGSYYLGAMADGDDRICETNETNNYVSTPLTVVATSCTADLVFSSGTPTATPSTVAAGSSVTMSGWSVKNQGTGSTGIGFTAAYYLSTDAVITSTDKYLVGHDVSALAAGATYTVSAAIPVPIPAGTVPGSYYIGHLADSGKAICESNESNNYVSTPLTVTAGTAECKADLVIASGAPGITPTTVAAGAKIAVANSVIKNQGSASTVSGFSIGFYLSSDAAITTSDTLLLMHSSPVLNAGATINTADVSLTIPAATPAGKYYVGVLADRENAVCETNESNNYASSAITVGAGCATPPAPSLHVPAQVLSATPYTVAWPAIAGASSYEIGEATRADFSDAAVKTLSATSQQYAHTVTAPARFYYRVRATASCNGSVGPYSVAGSVVVTLPPSGTDLDPNAAAPAGSTQPIVFKYLLRPPASKNALDTAFKASTDKTWLSVSPASGTIPPAGTTLTITAAPGSLEAGTNTGTLSVTTAAGTTLASAPMSVTLANPVTSSEKLAPQSNALIIPVVGYAKGSQSSLFLSDVRITNTSSQSVDYKLIFRPSRTNGNENGVQSSIRIRPQETKAINDVVRIWFGLGATGESALGSLEIRPLNFAGKDVVAEATNFATLGASRTYNMTSTGTFGQFIPAIPVAKFVGKPTAGHPNRISLQQIAQSNLYRTNFGIVEGSGNSVTALVTVYSGAGAKLGEKPMPLLPYEHQQWNALLTTMGIGTLADGRIEVTVTSDKGTVSAYASVVDNATNDPLLVFPVVPADIHARRWVVPGVADLNTGKASWRTDMRIFNGGLAAVPAVVTFQQSRKSDGKLPAPIAKNVTLQPGKVVAYDSILQSLFGVKDVSGLVCVTTAVDSSLVVTARTYDKQPAGTYGQFVPAVLPEETVGLGDRALQILQLEESARYRTNLGVAETAGKPVMVEIKALFPDSPITPKKEQYLDANEFLQFNRILAMMQMPTVYNARISVRVIGGTGRVTAYGSVVDNQTQDPTYVPAQ